MSNAAVINATSTSGQTVGAPISIETGGDVVLKAYGTGEGNWFVVMAFAPVVNGVTGAPVTLTIDYNQPGRQTSAVGTSATEWVGWVLDQGGTWQASGIVEGYQPGEALSDDLGTFASVNALPKYGVKIGARASVLGVQYTYGVAGWAEGGEPGAFGIPQSVRNGLVSIAILGQSNEAGAAKHWAPGTLGSTAAPTRFRSRHRDGWDDPISPRVQPAIYKIGATVYKNPMVSGSWWTLLADALMDVGYDINIYNCAAGSLSFVAHTVGRLNAWGANKAFNSQWASPGGGNLGFKGDFIIVGTKVFQCTAGGGHGIAFYHNPGVFTLTENNAWRDHIDDLFWAPPESGLGKTGAVAPTWANAVNVGDTLTDNDLTWTLVKTNETAFAAYPAANCVVNSTHPAWDPLGMIARVKAVLDAEPANRQKWVFLENGQSDIGTSDVYKTWYKTALKNMAQYFQAQGYKIAIGATCANPTVSPTGWDGKHPSQMISEAATEVVAELASPTNYIKGGDLWLAFGYGADLLTYPDATNSTTPGVHMTDAMMPKCARVWFDALAANSNWPM